MAGAWAFILKKEDNIRTWPNVCKLARILMVVPCTTVICERIFSVMNRVKNKVRNRLTIKHLSMLIRISMEKTPIGEFDWEAAYNKFTAAKKRRYAKCAKGRAVVVAVAKEA